MAYHRFPGCLSTHASRNEVHRCTVKHERVSDQTYYVREIWKEAEADKEHKLSLQNDVPKKYIHLSIRQEGGVL